jgi:hypothetical protein
MNRFLVSGRREHGQVPNPYRVGNLTAIRLLERHDPALASYLAAAAGKATSAPDYARIEADQVRQQQVERMREKMLNCRLPTLPGAVGAVLAQAASPGPEVIAVLKREP